MKKLFAFAAVALAAFAAQAGPVVIGTDFTAVPTNTKMDDGTTANGENGNGGYLTIYCTGCGTLANYGPTGTNHVYMKDASNNSYEVAAYQELVATPFANAGMVSGTYPNVMGLRVQVGNLGGSPYGTPLNIDLVVNGVHATKNRTTGSAPKLYYGFLVAANAPNIRTGFAGDYEALTFTPIEGNVKYVDCTNGSDTAYGDINHPLQHLQTASATAASGGALYDNLCSNSPACNGGASDKVGTPPGTQVVVRGGTCTPVGVQSTGNFARFAAFFRITGTAPGTGWGAGPITITSKPTELAVLDDTGFGSSAGGFLGNDTQRSGENNPYDSSTGWDHYIEMSWLKVIANPTTTGPRDGAPVNLAYGADYNRVSAMDLTWQSARMGAQHARCGGICGDGAHVRLFLNNIHDIYGDNTYDENHGIYPDSGASEATSDMTIAFNAITNVSAGSHLSMNASGCIGPAPGAGTCPEGSGYMQNLFIHNNFMKGSANASHTSKANIAFSNVQTAYVWNNVLLEADESAIDVSIGSQMTTNGFQVFHNSIANWDLGGNILRPAFFDQGGDKLTGADYRNNVVYRSSGTGASKQAGWDSIDGSQALGTFTNNTWFDATTPCGSSCIPQAIPELTACMAGVYGACGSGGQRADPLLNAVNFGTSSYDMTLQLGSPAIDFSAAETGIVPREWDFIFKPMAGTAWDAGAYERQ